MKAWFAHRWTRILAVLSLFGTVMAAIPYNLGTIATYIPPQWKVPALIAGLILFGVFQIIQSGKPKEVPEQIIRVYHHFPAEV